MATSERSCLGDVSKNNSENSAVNYGACAPSTFLPSSKDTAQSDSCRKVSISKMEKTPKGDISPTPGPSGSEEKSKKAEDPKNSAKEEKKPEAAPPRTKSNQRWMKLRTTVQLSSAMTSTVQKKPTLKREDSFLQRFSTRQMPNAHSQETLDRDFDTDNEDTKPSGPENGVAKVRKRRRRKRNKYIVNPDESFYFAWLTVVTACVLYNLWASIVRETFHELRENGGIVWFVLDGISDLVFIADVFIQFRTGYLEQGLMVYDLKKLGRHYKDSGDFLIDMLSLTPLDLIQLFIGVHPILRFPRFLKLYRACHYYYMVESRTIFPNVWRVANLVHILLILAHWFGCFYYLISEYEDFKGNWVYPFKEGPEYKTLTMKYLASFYWSTLTLTTIGDLPTPESKLDRNRSTNSTNSRLSKPRRFHRTRLLLIHTLIRYVFTIISYLIGVFIFATIVGQVGNVITNRNANRLEFERLLDGAKTYMRHHKVPGDMKKRVLRWYDYSWSRGRIQGGGDIHVALGLLPDKLKTELALHVNLRVLKKVTIFQECQPEFLHDLVLKMKAYIFTPGDLICRKGEVAREMFIIADGILDVMSECGHVLTTMKAGDFFGEIGILNLDGLNRRTADVRSVGYSELFSLSREDVLGALKDYPEAEEILETLGRKRLAEARKMAKLFKAAKGEATSPTEQDASSKKIVDKLRSDVKVLKNVLRRSRNSVKSRDKHLTRMSHVQSSEETDEAPDSPIGAGLPLLQRLKMLKEKQDREKAAGAQREGKEEHKKSEGKPAEQRSTVRTQVTGTRLDMKPKIQDCDTQNDAQKREQKKKEIGGKFKGALKKLQAKPADALESKIEPHSVTEKRAPSKSTSVPAKDTWGLLKKSAVSSVVKGKKRCISTSDVIAEKPQGMRKKRSRSASPVDRPPKKSLKTAVENMMKDRRRTKSLGFPSKSSSVPPSSSASSSRGGADPNAWEFEPALDGRKSEMKRYDSVYDLSPEYSDLPFVKKLEVLNAKQKSEEGPRSLSFDSRSKSPEDDVCLIRSQSEASAIQAPSRRSSRASGTVEQPVRLPFEYIRRSDTIIERPLDIAIEIEEELSSPDSNETYERRQLKSILKKMSEEEDGESTKISAKERQELMKQATVEGYAARRTKLNKNVTFNRRAVVESPPPTVIVEAPGSSGGTRGGTSGGSSGGTRGGTSGGSSGGTSAGAVTRASAGTSAASEGAAARPDPTMQQFMSGLETVMQGYMNQIERKFQGHFHALHSEIRRRDNAIKDLQQQCQNQTLLSNPGSPSFGQNSSFMRSSSLPSSHRFPSVSGPCSLGGAVKNGRVVGSYSASEEMEMRTLYSDPPLATPRGPVTTRGEYLTYDVDEDDDEWMDELDDEELHNKDWEVEMLAAEFEHLHLQQTQQELDSIEGDVEQLKSIVDGMDLANLQSSDRAFLKSLIRLSEQRLRKLSETSQDSTRGLLGFTPRHASLTGLDRFRGVYSQPFNGRSFRSLPDLFVGSDSSSISTDSEMIDSTSDNSKKTKKSKKGRGRQGFIQPHNSLDLPEFEPIETFEQRAEIDSQDVERGETSGQVQVLKCVPGPSSKIDE